MAGEGFYPETVAILFQGFAETMEDLAHVERVEDHEGEVESVFGDEGVGTVDDFDDGEFGGSVHDGVGAVVEFQKVEKQGEMGFVSVEEDTEVFVVFVDFSYHQFEEVGVVGDIFLVVEEVFFGDVAQLVDAY